MNFDRNIIFFVTFSTLFLLSFSLSSSRNFQHPTFSRNEQSHSESLEEVFFQHSLDFEQHREDDLFLILWRKFGESLSYAAKKQFVLEHGGSQFDYETGHKREKETLNNIGRRTRRKGRKTSENLSEGQNDWTLKTHDVVSSVGDCEVLQEFYSATGGNKGDWIISTGWNRTDFGTKCCEVDVYGLNCTADGRVSRISLPSNGLSGSILSTIYHLSELQSIDLSDNIIEGEIPSSIGNMTKLTAIVLFNNKLSGSIPREIGLLSQLVQLSLSSNVLSGRIPAEIGGLTKLKTLELGYNQLTGEIPSTLWTNGALETLELSNNELSGELSTDIVNLKNITSVHLESYHLSGAIPSSISQLSWLQQLNLGTNSFSGEIPGGSWQNSELTELSFASNYLTGTIPSGLCHCVNLKIIDVSDNQLHGSIPREIGLLKKLQTLNIRSNSIDTIPNEIAGCSNLAYFYADFNVLNGTFPNGLAQMSALVDLGLSRNRIESPLPDMTKMTSLKGLKLPGNLISDFDWKALPPQVMVLNLANNQLKSIDEASNIDGLSLFDVAGNKDLETPATALTLPISTVILANTKRVIGDAHFGLATAIQDASVIDLQYCQVEQFFPGRSMMFLYLTSLNLRGSLAAKARNELASTERNFIERIREDLPFLVDLDISENPAIVGSTDDFIGMLFLRSLAVEGCNIEGRFGGPLEIQINPHAQIPIEDHVVCFKLTGTNQLEIVIEESKFNYAHCYCDEGYYGHPPSCMACLDHALCEKMNPALNGLDSYDVNGWIHAEDGYWATPSYTHDQMNEGHFPTHVIPCRGVGTSDTPCKDDGKGTFCKKGYTGRKCDGCVDQYYRDFPACMECPGPQTKNVFLALSCLFWLFLIVIAFFMDSGTSSLAKITLFFVQGLALIRPPMPPIGYDALNYLNSILQFGFAGLKCYWDSYDMVANYIVTMLTPVFFTILIPLIYALGKITPTCWLTNKLSHVGEPVTWGLRSIRAYHFLLYFLYMRVAQVIVFPMRCEEDPGLHKEFMINAGDRECSTWLQVISSLLFVVFIVGLPILAAIMIHKYFNDAKKRGCLGVLIGGYPKKYRFWEIFIAFRRIMLLCATFLFDTQSQITVAWLAFLLVFSAILQYFCRPYSTKLVNGVEIVSLTLLVGNLAIRMGSERSVTTGSDPVSSAVFVINGSFAILLFVLTIRYWMRTTKRFAKGLAHVDSHEENDGDDEENERMQSTGDLQMALIPKDSSSRATN